MGLLDGILSLPLPVLLGLGVVAWFGYLLWTYRDGRAYGTRPRPDLVHSKHQVPLLGDILYAPKIFNNRLENLKREHEEYGEVFRTTAFVPGLGSFSIIHTVNPQDVETVLRDPYLFVKGDLIRSFAGDFFGAGIFASDGARWHSQRKTASHVFNARNFRSVFNEDFLGEVDKLCSHLARAAELGAFVDMQDLLLRCTLDSFGRLAMGAHFGCIEVEGTVVDGKYRLPPVKYMQAFDYLNVVVAGRGPKVGWRYLEKIDGTAQKIKEARATMFEVADKIIADKRAKIAKGEIVKESDSGHADMLDFFAATKNFDGGVPDNDELRDVVMNLLIAGRDTTAQTLTWSFYNLSRRPDIVKKCRDEISRVLGADRAPDYESLKELKYLTAVFFETLRLHSNVPTTTLFATKDTVLQGSGTKVYAGEGVEYSSWAMGYRKELWGPDAEEFKPERWIDPLTGSVRKENQYKYPVFKGGPRICLGQNMAIQEGVTFLAQVLRAFDLELVNEDEPAKWGVWNEDPAKREGRYDVAITLGARQSVEFLVRKL
ncbi:cytochrome P450 [Hyaloraphidium curvatum]|nr:cytochrome P450 [Hyaloraphidium curvatum]